MGEELLTRNVAVDPAAFFAAAKRRLQPMLRRASLAGDCAELMVDLHCRVEAALQPLDCSQVACAAGCGSCCRVNVAVLLPEAVAVVNYLNQIPSPGSAELAARVRELYRRTAGLDEQERLQLQAPCAFLSEQGVCQVYPVRPLLCRSVTSTDPAACRAALTTTALEQAPSVLMNLQQKALCEAAFIALAETARELNLDDRSTTLTTAVYHLLEQPDLAEAWLAGESVPQG